MIVGGSVVRSDALPALQGQAAARLQRMINVPSSLVRRVASVCGLVACAVVPCTLYAQRPVEQAPNAPKDQPLSIETMCQLRAMQRAQEPYVAQARASYPDAKRRFVAGLPPRHTFFVTTTLRDGQGRFEQVFLVVDSIVGTQIRGRIWSDVSLVSGYRLGQPHAVNEAEILDWLIGKPDGSEEGNFVGKFVDTYRPPSPCNETTQKE